MASGCLYKKYQPAKDNPELGKLLVSECGPSGEPRGDPDVGQHDQMIDMMGRIRCV